MGINLQTKFTRIFSIIAMIAMVSSCLPVQKKTQCGESEAFNASRRQCVPVIGASTSNTVFIGAKSPESSYSVSISQATPVTHTVAVSDVYNYGYTVRWYVHPPGGTAAAPSQTNSVSFAFYPFQYVAGQYIIEAVLYDQTGLNQLDSVSWNVTVANLTTPTLTSASPAATAYSYLNTITTNVTHQITISSPDFENGNYYFYLDGILQSTGTFSLQTTIVQYQFIPSNLTSGIHTVEVKLHDGTTSDPLFDSYTWVVNIINPEYPVIQPLGANTIPKLPETITIVDGINFGAGGWLDNTGSALTELCIQVDNSDKLVPAGPDIDVKMAVNGIDFETNAAETSAGSNKFCADLTSLNNAQNYFNLSNPDIGEARTIMVKTYATGTNNLVEALSWNVAVRPKNIRPVISIDGSNTSGSMACNADTAVSYSGCTVEQSVNVDIDSNSLSYSNNASDVNNVVNFALVLDYDPDIGDPAVNEDRYEVIFQIKKVGVGSWEDIDRTGGTITTSNYTHSDCTYSSADTAATVDASSKLICALNIDSFNANGPLASGDYQLRAYIRDANAGLGSGAAPKDSNTVAWNLTVTERQNPSSISIAPLATVALIPSEFQDYYVNGVDTGINLPLKSWITQCSDCASNPADVDTIFNENDDIVINTVVRDIERDNFSISISIDNNLVGGQSTLASTSIITRNDDKEYYTVRTSVKIPEWVATTAAQAVKIYVTVQDRPESYTPLCTTCATASAEFNITVNNNNPMPVFNDDSNVDLTGYKVFAGVPFEIPVSASDYTDASLYDGTNVTWKWQVSLDAGASWTDIENANKDNQATPKLVWTPDLDITSATDVQLRICLGDDGSGNDIANIATCPEPKVAETNIKQWINLTAYPAHKIIERTIANSSSGNELAQWYDQTAQFLYSTYTTGTNIYVEKLGFDSTTGGFKTIHSIKFPTEDVNAGKTPVLAEHLSISGIDSTSVVIAYKVNEDNGGVTFPEYRIRRIDTTNGKLSFNYCGFYNNDTSACDTADLFDQTNTTLDDLPGEVSFTRTGNSLLDINFLTVPSGGNYDLQIQTNAGIWIKLSYAGTTDNAPIGSMAAPKVIGYCNPNCGSAAATAQALSEALNNLPAGFETDADFIALTEEYYAAYTAAATNLVLQGPNILDYKDGDRLTPIIGNIQVTTAGTWFLPYLDSSYTNKLGVAKGINAHQQQGLTTAPGPSDTLIASSSINNQEVAMVKANTSLYIAVKNPNVNMDLFKLNQTTLSVDASVTNVYNLSSIDSVDNIKISAGQNDIIYASGISVSNAGASRELALSVFKSDLSLRSANATISAVGYEQYVENIDRAQVIADPNNQNNVFVALTTNISNTNPNKAYLIKLRYADTTTFSSSFNFHEYNYPQLNLVDTTEGGAISTTMLPTAPLVKGHKLAPNPTTVAAGVEDASFTPTFFGFHETATGNSIRTGFYNTDQNSIMTDDISTSGNYPAIIGN